MDSLVNCFYLIKPAIPRRLQLFLRRRIVNYQLKHWQDRWPIDLQSASAPKNWSGWPDGKKFAVVFTHDVDTKKGYKNCRPLMELELEKGFRSAFGFVPERDYIFEPELGKELTDNGFEIYVHDLKHDGKLFRSEQTFRRGAEKINTYLKEWNCKGFRAGAMHSNLDWQHLLNIEYDASTFDTDPFEPKPKHRRTIFPFWVDSNELGPGFVELPYTLPQDFTLFVIMKEQSNKIWRDKLDWVAQKGGMVLLNSHPDYMNFGKESGTEKYPVEYYIDFLKYIKEKYENQFWNPLPLEIARFWEKIRSE